MGQKFSRDIKEEEIISKRSLCAVLEIIEFLKENVRAEGIFRIAGRPQTRRKILASLRRGDRSGLRHQLDGAAIECAAALQMFLMHLREPLIPVRVQQLVLAENPGIPERTVASDALGLLRQDLSGRHLELLTSLLDLLYVATRNSPTSELRGCSLPVALLPIFFDLKPDDVARWKQVAATFNELIITAPTWLEACGTSAGQHRMSQSLLQNEQSQPMRIPTPPHDVQPNNDVMDNQQLAEEREEESVALLLRQRNRNFLGGEPTDRRLTSITTIPLVFHVQSRLHPLLRALS